jgi:N-acetylmuramoyl-L-alanine amidase
MTVKAHQNEPLNNESDVLIPRDVNSVFTYDSSRVVFSRVALEKRVSYANRILKNNPNCKIVFIALHFDNIKSTFSGARIIMGKSSISLADSLKKEFKLANLLSKSPHPVLKNADKKRGIRNLIVLKSTNKISQKVLIEFANCKNANDLKQIADYQTRDEYALIVTLSLARFMNSNNGVKSN